MRGSWFLLILLFSGSLCYAKNVEVVGFGECADCKENNIETTHALSGLKVTIDCKVEDGKFKTRGAGKLNEQGQFKVSLPQEILKNGKLAEECYVQLHNAANAPCAVHSGLEASKVTFQSKSDQTHTFGPTGKLKFSSAVCTSAFFWPPHKHPKLSFPKGHPWLKKFGHVLPPLPKIPFKKPCPPPVVKPPVYKPTPTPSPPVYTPTPKPPVYTPTPKPPVYTPKPPVYTPTPKPPVYTPTPKPPVYTPKPPMVPIYKPHPKIIPPSIPIYKPHPKILPPPIPIYKPHPKIMPPMIPIYKPHPKILPPIPYKKPCPPLTLPKLPPLPPKKFPPFPTLPPKKFPPLPTLPPKKFDHPIIPFPPHP